MDRVVRKVFLTRRFDGKVVLITGACAGIGRALAVRFAQSGARLVLIDLDQSGLDSLASHLQEHHNVEVLTQRCDVADADCIHASVALAVEQFGGIDVLINNAGITHRSTFEETSPEVFRRIMDVNYFGAVNCTQAALPSLQARKGQIIVLSSLSGFVPMRYRCAYNASKHALHGLFETLRGEVQEQGVNVMLVCPGFTATDILKNALVGDGSVVRQPVPFVGPVSSAQDTAAEIYRAACKRKRLLILSNVTWVARLLARLCPSLFERFVVPRISGLKPQ